MTIVMEVEGCNVSLDVLWYHMRKIWEKRGYKLHEIVEKNPEEIKAIFVQGDKRAFVYCTTKKLTVQLVRSLLQQMQSLECKEGTFATTEKATRQAIKEAEDAGVEVIHQGNPLIYVFDHWLVPDARILSPEEVRELEKKYGPLKYFPKILVTDPVCRILRAKPGDVIEFVRRVPPKEELIKRYGPEYGSRVYEWLRMLTPAGEERYYRVVVEYAEELPAVEEEEEKEEEKEVPPEERIVISSES